MSRVLYIDAFSGVAGDMVLAAFLDAGLPADVLRAAIGRLGVGHDLAITKVLRSGLSATHVAVVAGPQHDHGHHHHDHGHHHDDGHHHDHGHHHHHDHDHHHHDHGHDHGRDHGHDGHNHRTLAEIRELIGRSGLSAAGQSRAIAMFDRMGAAEASVHDVPMERVHLHEVGDVDSIIDIVGVVCAFEWLGIDDVVSSPLNVGGGTVKIAHGTFPVPAPATLKVLGETPVYSSGPVGELVTPTGALVVSTFAKQFGPMPRMRVDRVGYGAGTRDTTGWPNVVRLVIGERVAPSVSTEPTSADVIKIECEIDDMNPQLLSAATERVLAAGALDVFLTPIVMKKGRPGTLLTTLAQPADQSRLCDMIFRETTTIGVRFERVQRETLDRRWESVSIDGGVVRLKISSRQGEVLTVAPEFEDCARVAAATGRPVKDIHAEALRAWSGAEVR